MDLAHCFGSKELMSQDELAVMDGGKCILQLRGVTEIKSASAGKIEVEYGRLRQPATPEGEAELARVRSQIDTCKDVYGVTAGLGAEQFSIQTAAMASLPAANSEMPCCFLPRNSPGPRIIRSVSAISKPLFVLTSVDSRCCAASLLSPLNKKQ